MNLLEVAVIVMFALLAAGGFRRGFVRKLASMFSLVVSIVLVSLLLPYMVQFLKENTPVYEYITEQCRKAVGDRIGQGLSGSTDVYKEASLSGDIPARAGFREASLDLSGVDRAQIKELLEGYGYDASVIDSMSDDEIAQYASEYLGSGGQDVSAYLGDGGQDVSAYLGGGGQGTSDLSGILDTLYLSEDQQEDVIRNLPLPEFLREQLLKYNNSEGYRNLGVSTFLDYVINYVASAILNVVAFLLAVIFVQVVLCLILHFLDKLARVPGISLLNRIAGGALGLLQGFFFLWLFFLVLSMFEATRPGQAVLEMVQGSRILDFVYEKNLFLQIVLRAAAIFK